MSWNYDFNFFREKGNIDKEFVEKLVKILQNAKCQYLKQSGYWSNEKDDLVFGRPLEEAVEVSYKQGNGSLQMWYGEDGSNDLNFLIMFRPNRLGMLEVTISVQRVYLSSMKIGEDTKNGNTMLNISKCVYDFLYPFYGYADSENEHLENEELISKKIKHIYWANFFSPELVQKIGKEKLLSAPCWKVEELRDGCILIVLSPTIYYKDEIREEVERHLGFKQ